VLAVELLAATRGLQLRAPLVPSPAGRVAVRLVGQVAGEPGPDIFLAPVLAACRELVAGRELRAAVESAVGPLA
jgi:histidine ammonia-lyase